MEKSNIALGSAPATAVGTCLAVDPANLSASDRILVLEEQMRHLQRIIIRLKKAPIGAPPLAPSLDNANKDGIPIGTTCLGATEKSPFLYYLTVKADGYTVGSQKFASLSAAAEAISFVRRSGWTFWKLVDGRTLKEAYRT